MDDIGAEKLLGSHPCTTVGSRQICVCKRPVEENVSLGRCHRDVIAAAAFQDVRANKCVIMMISPRDIRSTKAVPCGDTIWHDRRFLALSIDPTIGIECRHCPGEECVCIGGSLGRLHQIRVGRTAEIIGSRVADERVKPTIADEQVAIGGAHQRLGGKRADQIPTTGIPINTR